MNTERFVELMRKIVVNIEPNIDDPDAPISIYFRDDANPAEIVEFKALADELYRSVGGEGPMEVTNAELG